MPLFNLPFSDKSPAALRALGLAHTLLVHMFPCLGLKQELCCLCPPGNAHLLLPASGPAAQKAPGPQAGSVHAFLPRGHQDGRPPLLSVPAPDVVTSLILECSLLTWRELVCRRLSQWHFTGKVSCHLHDHPWETCLTLGPLSNTPVDKTSWWLLMICSGQLPWVYHPHCTVMVVLGPGAQDEGTAHTVPWVSHHLQCTVQSKGLTVLPSCPCLGAEVRLRLACPHSEDCTHPSPGVSSLVGSGGGRAPGDNLVSPLLLARCSGLAPPPLSPQLSSAWQVLPSGTTLPCSSPAGTHGSLLLWLPFTGSSPPWHHLKESPSDVPASVTWVSSWHPHLHSVLAWP